MESVLNHHVRQLASLTWTEAAERLGPNTVILLPIGSVEAHGPHLGRATDVIIAQPAARGAADRFDAIGVDAWIAPPIWYGVSFGGASFPGATAFAAVPFPTYLAWVLRGLTGIAECDVIVVDTHLEPAQFDAVHAASEAMSQESVSVVHVVDHRAPSWASRLGLEFAGGSRHAGSYGTSIVLSAEPCAVRTEQLPAIDPDWIDLPARLRARAKTSDEAGGAQAYLKDPARATEAEGGRPFGEIGDMMVEKYLGSSATFAR